MADVHQHVLSSFILLGVVSGSSRSTKIWLRVSNVTMFATKIISWTKIGFGFITCALNVQPTLLEQQCAKNAIGVVWGAQDLHQVTVLSACRGSRSSKEVAFENVLTVRGTPWQMYTVEGGFRCSVKLNNIQNCDRGVGWSWDLEVNIWLEINNRRYSVS